MNIRIIYILTEVVIAIGCLYSCRYVEPKQWFSKDIDTLIEYSKTLEKLVLQDSVRYQGEIDRIRTQAKMREDSLRMLLEKNITISGRKYVIVTGSFKLPVNARRYSRQMIGLGYSGEILTTRGGYHLVSTGSYGNLQQALIALRPIRDNVQAEAWIYIRE